MKTTTRSIYAIFATAVIAIGLSACGGGGSTTSTSSIPTITPKTTPFTVGGYVGGLASGAQVTLLNNGVDALTVTANGSFTFATPVQPNGNYAITVGTQPATQTCSVTNGSGNGTTTYNFDITSVRVNCATAAKYAYVAYAGGSGGVSQYTISGGLLTPMATATVAAGTSPSAVTASPNGQYVYVANSGSSGAAGSISQYAVGSGGALAPMTSPSVASGTSTLAVQVDPSGRYAYAANFGTGAGAGSVSQYTINQTTGALTPMSPATVAADVGSNSVTIDPTGAYVYVANSGSGSSGGTISQYTIGAGGALTPMSPATVSVGGTNPLATKAVLVTPDNKYAYALTSGNISQFSVGTNGALTYMGNAFGTNSPADSFNSLGMDSFGANIYATGPVGGGIEGSTQISITANGNLMSDMWAASGSNPVAIIADQTGTFAFAVNNASSTISQYTISATNSNTGMAGSLNPVSTVATGANPKGIALAP